MRKLLMWPLALCLSWAMTGLAFGQAAATETDDVVAEKLLPPQTLLFFSIPSVENFREGWNGSSMGRLIADPAVKPILEELTAKMEEGSKEIEQHLGVTLDELLALPQGEITVAVVEKPARKLAPLVLIDMGDNGETVEKLLEKMDAALEQAGCEHSTLAEGDFEFNVYKLPESDDNPFKTFAYFEAEGYLVFSTEVAALKSVTERWDGGDAKTLADQDVYKYIEEKCSTDDQAALIKWYVNPLGLIQAGVAMIQAQQPQAGLVLGVLPILGLDKLKGIGGGMDMAVGEFDSVSKTFFYVEQPTSGVLSIFQFPAIAQTPPKWVHDDVASYSDFNWDVTEAYVAIETMIDSFQGPGAFSKIIDSLEAEGNTPVHVKKDLIDQLTGRVQFITEAPEGTEGIGEIPKMLFSIGLKDGAAMTKTLAKVAKSDDFPGKSRQFKGQTVYEISPNDDDQTISLTVNESNLVIATTTNLMEHLLQPSRGGALVDSADYKAIAKHFPKKTAMIGYGKQGPQMKALYDMLLKQKDSVDDVDLGKLPEWSELEKYFRDAGSYAVPDEKGALMVQFSLPE